MLLINVCFDVKVALFLEFCLGLHSLVAIRMLSLPDLQSN